MATLRSSSKKMRIDLDFVKLVLSQFTIDLTHSASFSWDFLQLLLFSRYSFPLFISYRSLSPVFSYSSDSVDPHALASIEGFCSWFSILHSSPPSSLPQFALITMDDRRSAEIRRNEYLESWTGVARDERTRLEEEEHKKHQQASSSTTRPFPAYLPNNREFSFHSSLPLVSRLNRHLRQSRLDSLRINSCR